MALRFESLARELYHCADCNYCVDAVWPERGLRHVCPTLVHHAPLQSYSGRGYLAAARAWREGAALDLAALADRAFTCTTCGHCETVCPIGLHPTEAARALRGALWEEDVVPPAIRHIVDALHRHGSPTGATAEARAMAGISTAPETAASVFYLPGCAVAGEAREEGEAALALILASGQAVAALPQDHCCGAPHVELGLNAEGQRLAEDLARRAGAGATVLLSGLECAQQWRRVTMARSGGEPAADRGLTIVSTTRFIAEALATERLRLRRRHGAPPPVRLQYSCQSRAQRGDIEDLHAICTHLGVERLPTESPTHVLCCGAAGGMPAMAPESAARMACARVASNEAFHLVADPRCLAHLRRANPAHSFAGVAGFLHRFFEPAP